MGECFLYSTGGERCSLKKESDSEPEEKMLKLNACYICKCIRAPSTKLLWGEGEYVLEYPNYRANLHVPFELLGEQINESSIRGFWEAVLHAYFCSMGGIRFVTVHEIYLAEILEVVADWIHRWKQPDKCSDPGKEEIRCYSK